MLAGLTLCGPLTAQAELEPSEVAVLANSSFGGSVELAKYYCTVRNIPTSHIIALVMPDGELVGRGLYEKSIVLQVRQALKGMPDGENIRCLVSIRGVPMRIGPSQPTQQELGLIDELKDKKNRAVKELEGLLQRANKLAGLASFESTATVKKSQGTELIKQTLEEINRAGQKIKAMPESVYKQKAGKEFEQIVIKILGLAGTIEKLSKQGPTEADDPRARQLAELKSEFSEISLKIK